MRTIACSLTTLALAGTLAACGGTSSTDYTAKVRTVQQAAVRDVNTANTAMDQARTTADVRKLLRTLGTDLSQHAAELGTIEAPSKVAANHRAYTALFARFGRAFSDLGDLVTKARGQRSVEALKRAARRVTGRLAAQETPLVARINEQLK